MNGAESSLVNGVACASEPNSSMISNGPSARTSASTSLAVMRRRRARPTRGPWPPGPDHVIVTVTSSICVTGSNESPAAQQQVCSRKPSAPAVHSDSVALPTPKLLPGCVISSK